MLPTQRFCLRARSLCLAGVLLFLSACAAQTNHREGQAAMERKAYAEGVLKLEKAAELRPDDANYRRDWLRAREIATARLLSIGGDALAEGKHSEAASAYRTILSFERENSRAQAGVEAVAGAVKADEDAAAARLALKRGDNGQAGELAGRALRGVPNHVEARAVRRELDAQQAQEMLATPTLGAIYKKPINLEFRDASVKTVFDALSRTTGINFIFDRDVKGDQRTTVFLKQTTLDDAIDVILSTGQLEKKILNSSSVLIYPNTPAKTREYQDLVVRVFYLANVEAKNAANMLKTVLKVKDVFVDDKVNMLILRENPETIALAERLIALHDMEEGEVMLEVEVLEINRSRLLNLGVQVSDQLTIAPLGGGSGTGASLPLNELRSLNSSKLGITLPSATINLQKIDGDATLLANPRIRVRDREKAKILIGDKVPVVTTTSSGTFVSENVQYIDVGLKLEVEPVIYLRDEIGLKLALEVSSLVSSIKTSSGSQAYQIGTRNFNSSLRLKDGETQILAGLINDEDRSAANRIPLLGELPLLGRLFSSQSDNRKKTEIVLSITPRLIRNIQRKEPSTESFWSGTEGTLKNKPLQLREFKPEVPASMPGTVPAPAPRMMPAVAPGAGTPPAVPALPAIAPQGQGPVILPIMPPGSPEAPRLTWQGPQQGKVGQPITLTLEMDSQEALRAASLQLAFNPAEIEVLKVEEGDYFSRSGKGAFSNAIDKTGGRVSIGASSADGGAAKGAARVLSVTIKPLVPALMGTDLSLISATPVGGTKAVGRPGLPIVHKIVVGP
jgi:general secretion pathway protein D